MYFDVIHYLSHQYNKYNLNQFQKPFQKTNIYIYQSRKWIFYIIIFLNNTIKISLSQIYSLWFSICMFLCIMYIVFSSLNTIINTRLHINYYKIIYRHKYMYPYIVICIYLRILCNKNYLNQLLLYRILYNLLIILTIHSLVSD